MTKQLYLYNGIKKQQEGVTLQLSRKDLLRHKKVVDAIIETGVIDMSQGGEYLVEIQKDDTIIVLLGEEPVGIFCPANVH